jgi:hypothetical protein
MSQDVIMTVLALCMSKANYVNYRPEHWPQQRDFAVPDWEL